jgi:anti-sigma regulatory factor (Ser/Thr protein kinase)
MRELSLHILDLVQNSIEAAASKVILEVIENSIEDSLVIRVSDNGRGIDEKIRRHVVDPFVTTRTTRRVGLGLPLIDMSTKRCGGYLRIASESGQGTRIEAMYQYRHLDRPPLGNMVDTIKSILVAYPDLDFQYQHIVNGSLFSISTCEIVDVLGDIPLTHPAVLEWLQEYLTGNFAKLYGGVTL